LALLRAMNGDFEQARSLYRRGRATLRELGQGVNAAANGIDVLQVELLAGDLASAEREVMADLAFLERAGETFYLSTIAALLSRVVRDQGRDEDALVLSRRAEDATAADDVESIALWRSIRAPILARAGRMAEAESLARSAVELSQGSDAPQMQADSLSELATVLVHAGRLDEARQAVAAAVSIYRGKGDVVSAARAATMAARLG
jgi:ATP/maltotriose-dependent transcriptional regulator MalT